jgi:adenylosuccinate lyase
MGIEMIERYSRNKIASIWTLENKFRIWLDIEVAACEANNRDGIVPDEDLAIIKEKANFDLKRIEEIEAEVHHDVIAFFNISF